MHLSYELQTRLRKLKSTVMLASTLDGTFPGKDAFYHEFNRGFRAAFASSEQVISIVLYERTDKQKHDHCFARGLFSDIDRLATVIDLWIAKEEEILAIKIKFDELELYADFDNTNPNHDIDKAWTKIKNRIFNNTEFWTQTEWNERYLEMLKEAKQHPAFTNYFPFTSLYWLRFSIDKDMKETWMLDTYIVPTMYSKEMPTTLGKFYVSFNDKPMGGEFFETAKEALDFYAEKLQELKPIKWC